MVRLAKRAAVTVPLFLIFGGQPVTASLGWFQFNPPMPETSIGCGDYCSVRCPITMAGDNNAPLLGCDANDGPYVGHTDCSDLRGRYSTTACDGIFTVCAAGKGKDNSQDSVEVMYTKDAKRATCKSERWGTGTTCDIVSIEDAGGEQ